MVNQERKREQKDVLRLGQLIALLETVEDKTRYVYFDFCRFRPDGSVNSYRGYYEDLALGYTDQGEITAARLIEKLKHALGNTYEGYKGGEYTMDENTLVWVANYGRSSDTAITFVEDHDYMVIVRTEHVE